MLVRGCGKISICIKSLWQDTLPNNYNVDYSNSSVHAFPIVFSQLLRYFQNISWPPDLFLQLSTKMSRNFLFYYFCKPEMLGYLSSLPKYFFTCKTFSSSWAKELRHYQFQVFIFHDFSVIALFLTFSSRSTEDVFKTLLGLSYLLDRILLFTLQLRRREIFYVYFPPFFCSKETLLCFRSSLMLLLYKLQISKQFSVFI